MSTQSTQRPPFLLLFGRFALEGLLGVGVGVGVGLGLGVGGGGKEIKEKSQPHRQCLKQTEAQKACAESATLTADQNWLFHGTDTAP